VKTSRYGSKVIVFRSEVNETILELIGNYIAAVYDDVMPDYVIVGDGKNYSSNITNVSLLLLFLAHWHFIPRGLEISKV